MARTVTLRPSAFAGHFQRALDLSPRVVKESFSDLPGETTFGFAAPERTSGSKAASRAARR